LEEITIAASGGIRREGFVPPWPAREVGSGYGRRRVGSSLAGGGGVYCRLPFLAVVSCPNKIIQTHSYQS